MGGGVVGTRGKIVQRQKCGQQTMPQLNYAVRMMRGGRIDTTDPSREATTVIGASGSNPDRPLERRMNES